MHRQGNSFCSVEFIVTSNKMFSMVIRKYKIIFSCDADRMMIENSCLMNKKILVANYLKFRTPQKELVSVSRILDYELRHRHKLY